VHLAVLIRNVFREFKADREGTVYSDPGTDNLSALFSIDRSILLVAEEAGEILGCCGIYPTKDLPAGCVELVKLYLRREARGRGIGRELMHLCLKHAKRMGYTSVYLESLPEFSAALTMYEKAGFRKIPARMGSSGHFACNIWMKKSLEDE
jgi:putative acetyltransferase